MMAKKTDLSKKQRNTNGNGLAESPELAHALVRSAGTGIYIVQNGNFVYVNSLFEEMTGYTAKELVGTRSLEHVHPEDINAVREAAIESLKGGSPHPYEYRFLRKSGDEMWILERVTSTEYQGKRAAVGSFMDITKRKRAEQKLVHQSIVLRALKALDMLVAEELDKDFLIDHVCNLLVQAGNYANVWIVSVDGEKNFVSLVHVVPTKEMSQLVENMKLGRYPRCIRDVLEGEKKYNIYHDPRSLPDERPSLMTEDSQAAFVTRLETAGRIHGVMGISISELSATDEDEWLLLEEVAADVSYMLSRIEAEQLRRKSEQQMTYMALHDALTGLPNRTLLSDRLNVAVAQASRNSHKIAVMMLDLDRFKNVNDSLGHGVGDELLKAVAQRLADILRRSDTVARMGGDEFIILLPQVNETEYAARVARKLLNSFKKPFMVEGHELRMTTSIGVALYPEAGEDAESLLRHADTAMYRAKERGRDRYCVWISEQNEWQCGS
jgi:diguanylate cyclase (GGDEF)-like protein/PAS domain S-box-containing protein